MKKRVLAVIDLGTNTFHLLIVKVEADGTYQFIHRDRRAVMIGKGGINKGLITKEAQGRALAAIEAFSQTIKDYQIDEVHATATSAFRNASNQDEIVRLIKEKTGISVLVIDGEREAELIFMGVKEALTLDEENGLIMDIGGGSVELIICNARQIHWKRSFEIGAQRLLDRFEIKDPISNDNINELNAYFEQQLTELIQAATMYQPQTLIGASGTFDTFSDIYLARQQQKVVESDGELPLNYQSFLETHHALTHKNRQERMQIPGMIEMRVDMIVVASCLVQFIMQRLQINKIRVSAYALKEGLLRQIIDQQN
ncbi:MAG: exopolyphosphatase [Cyclobacteriaceae bacterium]